MVFITHCCDIYDIYWLKLTIIDCDLLIFTTVIDYYWLWFTTVIYYDWNWPQNTLKIDPKIGLKLTPKITP